MVLLTVFRQPECLRDLEKSQNAWGSGNKIPLRYLQISPLREKKVLGKCVYYHILQEGGFPNVEEDFHISNSPLLQVKKKS